MRGVKRRSNLINYYRLTQIYFKVKKWYNKKLNMLKEFPSWLRKRIIINKRGEETSGILKILHLHTVCEEARCPNINECFSQSTATFMILGNICTRDCRFCGVKNGKPLTIDNAEPLRVAEASKKLNLKYVVITSVTRDDLFDGGAVQFAKTIKTVKEKIPESKVEVLVPDFKGSQGSLKKILLSKPDVFNHNVETVKRLYPKARPQANYSRSLKVLKFAKEAGFVTKSGMMLGLGEKKGEVIKAMEDLQNIGCNLLTLGQYLQPNKKCLEVERFVPPEEFSEYKEIGEKLGFTSVVAGPFVRSSYHAKEMAETYEQKRGY